MTATESSTVVWKEPGLADQRDHRRIHPRVVAGRPVEYRQGGKKAQSVTKDIAPTGLFMITPDILPVGTQVDLSVELDPGADPIEVSGEVIRTAPDEPGVAVRFNHDGQRQARAAIGAFVTGTLDEISEGAVDTTLDAAPPIPTLEESAGWITSDDTARWEAALRQRQEKLETAAAALAAVRQSVRASRKETDEREAEIARREREIDLRAKALISTEQGLEAAAAAQATRARELQSTERRLVVIAQQVKAERAEAMNLKEALDARSASLDELRTRLSGTERQLQVHAFERNRLARQVKQLKSERGTLADQVERLSHGRSTEAQTKQILMVKPDASKATVETTSEGVPKFIESPENVPTAVYPVDSRVRWMRIHATFRRGFERILGFLRAPAS